MSCHATWAGVRMSTAPLSPSSSPSLASVSPLSQAESPCRCALNRGSRWTPNRVSVVIIFRLPTRSPRLRAAFCVGGFSICTSAGLPRPPDGTGLGGGSGRLRGGHPGRFDVLGAHSPPRTGVPGAGAAGSTERHRGQEHETRRVGGASEARRLNTRSAAGLWLAVMRGLFLARLRRC